jgi:hypothetical protein
MCNSSINSSSGYPPLVKLEHPKMLQEAGGSFSSTTSLSSLLVVAECRNCVRSPSSPKKVSFAPFCETVFGIRRQDYSVAETEACWYTDDESAMIRTKSIRIVKRMMAGTAKGLCTRGLEHLTPMEADARNGHREDAYDAVLDEQETQYAHGFNNPERIASLYYEAASCESQLRAQAMAANDAVSAVGIHREGCDSHDSK